MEKQEVSIREYLPKDTHVCKIRATNHGGVANLLRILTRTMVEQGSTIKTIAKVQYAVCAQAGVYIPDEFITDVLVAAEIVPNILENYEKESEEVKNSIKLNV